MQRRRFLIIVIALLLSSFAYLSASTLLPQRSASAHAYVIGSDPVDGSTVNTVPKTVNIYFNATISPLSSVRIYAIQPQGTLLDVTASHSSISASNPRELITPLQHPASLPEGGYEVYWTAISQDDGHTTFGRIGFNVGYSSTGLSGTPLLGPTTSNDLTSVQALDLNHFTNILSIIWEWLILAAIVVWIGMLLIEQLLLTHGERTLELLTRTQKRSRSLQWLCLSTILFGEMVSFILRFTMLTDALHTNLPYQFTNSVSPSTLATLAGMLTQTGYGLYWLIRVLLLLVAMGFLYRTTRPKATTAAVAPHAPSTEVQRSPDTEETPAISEQLSTSQKKQGKTREPVTPIPTALPSRRTRIFWLALAGLFLFFTALARVPAQSLQPHLSALIIDWLGLLAQAAWFGGFAYLGYILLPLFNAKELEYHTETLIDFLRHLTPFMWTGISIQLFSTLFLSEAAITTPQQFFTDPYGRTLLVQFAIVLIVLVLSLYVLFVVCPRLVRQVLLLPVNNAEMPTRRVRQYDIDDTHFSLKQLSNVIAIFGIGFLLCSALLSFFSPPIVFPNVTYTNPVDTSTGAANVQSKQLGDLTATLLLQPGHIASTNTVILTLTDKQGNLVTDAQIQLTTNMPVMNMGTQQVTINEGHPTYVATFPQNAVFNMAGMWDIAVTIQRPGQAAVQGLFHVTLT